MSTNCHDCKHCVRILVDNSKHKSADECAPLACNETLALIASIGNGDGTLAFGTDCPSFIRDEAKPEPRAAEGEVMTGRIPDDVIERLPLDVVGDMMITWGKE